jgi:hypothetical protein
MRILYILILSFLLFGCDLFTGRSAEQPNVPRGTYTQPVNPEDVVSNLKNALTDKNVQNYISCLLDSTKSTKKFQFISSGGTVFQENDSWTIKNEEQYFQNLIVKIPENQQIVLALDKENYSSPQGDSIVYTAGYTLSVPHNDSKIPVFYQGDIKLVLIRDNHSTWAISTWQDIKNSNIPTWSDLKGWFY